MTLFHDNTKLLKFSGKLISSTFCLLKTLLTVKEYNYVFNHQIAGKLFCFKKMSQELLQMSLFVPTSIGSVTCCIWTCNAADGHCL